MPEWDSDRLWGEIKDVLTEEQFEFIQYEIEQEKKVANIQKGIRFSLQNRLDHIVEYANEIIATAKGTGPL